MASVKIILRQDKKNAQNEAPLYLRIIKDRKAQFISLNFRVNIDDWNDEKSLVKKSNSNYMQWNSFLQEKKSNALNSALEMEKKNKNISTRKIKENVMGKAPLNFFIYTRASLEKMKSSVSYSTYEQYGYLLNSFQEFVGHTDLFFDEITHTLLKDYESHLTKTKKVNMVTVRDKMKIIKIMFMRAINEDKITYDIFPFNKYKVKVPVVKKNFLSEEQLEKLMNLNFKEKSLSGKYRDMFVFSCYAGGLRFSDLAELKWQHFDEKEQRLSKTIIKTNRPHSFKLPSAAIDIINKYNGCEHKPSDYIFGVIGNNTPFTREDNSFYLQKQYRLSYAEGLLRKIGDDLNLPFRMTFHVARHTFATRALNRGMRIEHVSKIMDHSSIVVTQIYAKIISEELDKAMEVLE
jgi:site-specific recombinase XerD